MDAMIFVGKKSHLINLTIIQCGTKITLNSTIIQCGTNIILQKVWLLKINDHGTNNYEKTREKTCTL